MNLVDIMPLVACLPFAALLIHISPELDGEATRQLERAAEAQEWLEQMKGNRQ